MPTLNERLEALFTKEDWRKARGLLEKELHKTPDSHWLLTRLGTTYYEERDYAKALEFARQAYRLAPNCPLVLWDLAGALDAAGDVEGALHLYRQLVRKGPAVIGTDECGEGIAWAVGLLIDCVYRLGLCCEQLDRISDALLFYHAFLDLRADWQESSISTAADAERHIARLAEQRPDYLERELGELRREMSAV
jgi:hypothetical protein